VMSELTMRSATTQAAIKLQARELPAGMLPRTDCTELVASVQCDQTAVVLAADNKGVRPCYLRKSRLPQVQPGKHNRLGKNKSGGKYISGSYCVHLFLSFFLSFFPLFVSSFLCE
jgi:hypothetical protein